VAQERSRPVGRGNISGATTAHLQVSNLTAADAANYDVVLTTGSSSSPSQAASLTVLPAESASPYETALLAAGPVAYYRLNETGNPAANNLLALDNAGAFNGTYGAQVTNAFAGVAGPRPADGFPGFRSDNGAALFTPYAPEARIPLPPWNLNTNTLTIAAWVNPAADQLSLAAVVYTVNTNDQTAGLNYHYEINASNNLFSVGYNWRNEFLDFFWDSQVSPPINQWSLLALTLTQTNASIYILNTNGPTVAVNDGSWWTNTIDRAVLAFDVPEYIGTDTDDPAGARNFNGTIDEVAVFNKALTQDQLQTIYNAALGILPPPPVTLEPSASAATFN
jgi:hypothetical protein